MIALFTDSAANLPAELTARLGIQVIPFTYTENGVEKNPLDAGFDGAAFYDALRGGAIVKTSMVNAAAFEERFAAALVQGKDVLYIGLSGGISGTVAAARMAAEELRPRFPERKIEVVDSLGASLGEGLLVLEAAAQILRGDGLEAVLSYTRKKIGQMCQCFTVEDLGHLRKGGRISGAAALVGGLLGIRPVLAGSPEGKIVMTTKVRGFRAVLDRLAESYDRLALRRTATVGIAHADNEAGAAALLARLRERGFLGSALTVGYEPVTGSHVGPGALALFFFGEDRTQLLEV